jgi:hypothetical protein
VQTKASLPRCCLAEEAHFIIHEAARELRHMTLAAIKMGYEE